jgi:hypothetical protein
MLYTCQRLDATKRRGEVTETVKTRLDLQTTVEPQAGTNCDNPTRDNSVLSPKPLHLVLKR